MLSIIQDIPNVQMHPLAYIFERLKLQHKPNTLWLEFGVYEGHTVNYISQFTNDIVYGFDSFEGLPEKWRDGFDVGMFSRRGLLPYVHANVHLVKGWFNETLVKFIETKQQKVSFIHVDVDLYSATKYVLDVLKPYMDVDCVISFDEILNFPGFDGNASELKAFYEFVIEHQVEYEWLGMNGRPVGMTGNLHEKAAVVIHSVKVCCCQ